MVTGRSPFFSIIIPAYNRADEIDELLGSLEKMKEPKTQDFECLIVDDGSTDHTKTVVQQHMERSDFPIRFIQQENQGPGAARNNGMEQAEGQFFIFLDSDALVHPGWLQSIEQAVEDGAEAFGGPDAASADFTPLQKAINYSMTSIITTGGIRGKKKRVGRYYPRSFNMGLSRQVYEQAGGFGDLRHGQDIEFSQRIIDTGARVEFVSEAIVYHKRRTSLWKFFKQVFNWGVARINLYKMHRELLEPVHTFPALATVAAFLVLVLSILGVNEATLLLQAGVVVLLLMGIHAGAKNRSPKVGLLVLIVIPIQIFGYGFGFLWAFFRRVIFGRGEFTGFQKNYYN